MHNHDIERVAETHNLLRPMLVDSLRQRRLSGSDSSDYPDCATYYDLWKRQLGDRYFDMGALIRAAASVETGLRDYYAMKKGYINLAQLWKDPKYKQNIFQRIQPWKNDGVQLLRSVGVDLVEVRQFPKVQELMLHRHLYAHKLGVIDDQYIKDLKRLTGVDLMANPDVSANYPEQDKVWFEPLSRVGSFIQAVRGLFGSLP